MGFYFYLIMMMRKYYKYIGLFIALVIPVLWSVFSPVFSTNPLTNSLLKELCMWSLFAVVVLIAKYGEQEPISFYPAGAGLLKTVGRSLLIVASMVLIGIVYRRVYLLVTHAAPPHEAMMDKLYHLPLWFKLLITVRAGVIEETFFRAYGMSRVGQLTNNKFLAFIIPLLFFAFAHYGYGTINHMAGAFALGLGLSLWYLKTKNLASNIMGHTLFDFLGLLIDKS